LPAVDVVLVPRGRLVELDLGVVPERRVNQAGDRFLEGVVEDGARLTLQALALDGEGGLGVVEEAGADGVGRDILGVDEVDAGRGGALRAVVEEDLGQGVGQQGGRVQAARVARVLSRVEAQTGRALELPGGEVEGLAELGGGGRREAGGLEEGEELGGVGGRGQVHGEEDSVGVLAGLGVGLREVLLCGERGRERVGVGPEEHGVRDFWREADLPQARDDFLKAGALLHRLLQLLVGLVLEVAGLDS
jgi:hypothetical protein